MPSIRNANKDQQARKRKIKKLIATLQELEEVEDGVEHILYSEPFTWPELDFTPSANDILRDTEDGIERCNIKLKEQITKLWKRRRAFGADMIMEADEYGKSPDLFYSTNDVRILDIDGFKNNREYLHNMIPDHAEGYAPYSEKQFESLRTKEPGSFEWDVGMYTALGEIARIIEMTNGAKYALQLYVLLRTELLYDYAKKCTSGPTIPDAIKWIDRQITHGIQGCLRVARFTANTNIFATISNCPTTREHAKLFVQHWIFGCWREYCYHDAVRDYLDMLQREAYVDFRVAVLRAVNNRLPQELIETIFNWALDIESIPRDPRIYITKKFIMDKHWLGMSWEEPVKRTVVVEDLDCFWSKYSRDECNLHPHHQNARA